jgi:hypothetical protein
VQRAVYRRRRCHLLLHRPVTRQPRSIGHKVPPGLVDLPHSARMIPLASRARAAFHSGMPTPRKKPASPAKPTPPSPPPAADPGELAFTKLQPQLAALPADRLGPPRAEVRAAASFVLSDTVPRLADPSLRARLLSLPKTEFHHAAIDDLGLCAQALLWAQSRLAQAEAEPSTAKLPLNLVQESVSLRQRMIEVCAYQFRDDAHLQKQVDDIRAGQGYLDLAEDLRRLAALYRSEHAQLVHDQRFYHPGDADTALHLSQRITSELRIPRPDASRESVWRAFALLVQLYEEVARAARFLLREAGESDFPSLFAIARSPARRKPAPQVPHANPRHPLTGPKPTSRLV